MTTPNASRPRTRRALWSSIALTAAALTSSCQLSGDKMNDHWTFESVPPRIARTMLGYDASKESSYKDFAWDRKQANGLTFRRYFLNHNPLNPNQRAQESRFEPRPLNSLAPNPWNYIHMEGIVMGLIATGGFVPIPVDSIIGTFEEGGPREFAQGFRNTFSREGAMTGSDARALYGEDGEAPAFQMTENAR